MENIPEINLCLVQTGISPNSRRKDILSKKGKHKKYDNVHKDISIIIFMVYFNRMSGKMRNRFDHRISSAKPRIIV